MRIVAEYLSAGFRVGGAAPNAIVGAPYHSLATLPIFYVYRHPQPSQPVSHALDLSLRLVQRLARGAPWPTQLLSSVAMVAGRLLGLVGAVAVGKFAFKLARVHRLRGCK